MNGFFLPVEVDVGEIAWGADAVEIEGVGAGVEEAAGLGGAGEAFEGAGEGVFAGAWFEDHVGEFGAAGFGTGVGAQGEGDADGASFLGVVGIAHESEALDGGFLHLAEGDEGASSAVGGAGAQGGESTDLIQAHEARRLGRGKPGLRGGGVLRKTLPREHENRLHGFDAAGFLVDLKIGGHFGKS